MSIFKRIVALALAGMLLAAIVLLFVNTQTEHRYPFLQVVDDKGVEVTVLQQDARSAAVCESTVSTFTNAVTTSCPTCKIREAACLTRLDETQSKYLSSEPIDAPALSIVNGVFVFRAADMKAALEACSQAARASSSKDQPIVCSVPGTARPILTSSGAAGSNAMPAAQLPVGMLLLGLAGLVSLLTNYLIVRYQKLHERWSLDHLDSGPQKFHETPTPRIGGLGIILGLLIASTALLALQSNADSALFGLLLLASLPAFAGGFAEDLLKNVGVRTRLLLTMLAGTAAAWLVGGVIPRLDIPFIDEMLKWAPLAVALSIFAVAGFANAINIIDGYNGLASGYSMIVLAAIAIVAHQLGDVFILCAALAMLGALLGFFVWNYPEGKIFLGDGGAYLLGFWIAELCVLLVARHPVVSPWFALLLLIYPVFETLFSIYRRTFLRRHSPGHPDALHLHQLIFRRLLRDRGQPGGNVGLTARNSKVAKYFWGPALACAIAAILWYQRSEILAVAVLTYCIFYILMYRRIARFRAPRVLISEISK